MEKVIVIGAGISGITSASLLDKKYNVTLVEALPRLGGHTNTINVPTRDGVQPVDTGFIVLNDANYALLHELFQRWGTKVRWSDMSFSFYDSELDFHYAGTTLLGLFSKYQNVWSPRFYSFLMEIGRFAGKGSKYLDRYKAGTITENMTLGEFLDREKFSQDMIDLYLLPMGSAIWSVPTEQMREFPLISFLNFFKNHGLLGIFDRPKWQTVVGGSSSYLSDFKSQFRGTIKLSSPVKKVKRSESGITVEYQSGGSEECDRVVFAVHGDQVLNLLDQPTDEESEVLSKWEYEENLAILHSDSSIMPPKKCAWASWNYHGRGRGSPAKVTYYMNLLQGIKSDTDYFVSLNAKDLVREDKIIESIKYMHPKYSSKAIESQSKLFDLQGHNRSYFCGSYFGNGFHEDGVRSGAWVASMLGSGF